MAEFKKVFASIIDKNSTLFLDNLGTKIEIEELILFGHSYGGATVL